MSNRSMFIYSFANRLAGEIMTVADPRQPSGERECTRAAMMSVGENGKEVEVAGRNKASITEVIETAFYELIQKGMNDEQSSDR